MDCDVCSTRYDSSRRRSPSTIDDELSCVATEWVDSTSAYQYDSTKQAYLQTALSNELLQNLLKFNLAASEKIVLTEAVFTERSHLEAGTPLRRLLEIGAAEPVEAPSILEKVMKQLSTQSE